MESHFSLYGHGAYDAHRSVGITSFFWCALLLAVVGRLLLLCSKRVWGEVKFNVLKSFILIAVLSFFWLLSRARWDAARTTCTHVICAAVNTIEVQWLNACDAVPMLVSRDAYIQLRMPRTMLGNWPLKNSASNRKMFRAMCARDIDKVA